MPSPLVVCSDCKFFVATPGSSMAGECHAIAPRPRPGSEHEVKHWPAVSGSDPPCGDALPRPAA